VIEPAGALVVKSHDAAEQLLLVDRLTGTFEIRPAGEVAHGFGHVVNGMACAVYADAGELILQCGRQRCSLGESSVKLEISRSQDLMVNTFRVARNGYAEFEVTYPSVLNDPLVRRDPTYDTMDEELEDFFVWVAQSAGNPRWVSSVSRVWAEGLKSPTGEPPAAET
jgi:hypothetical protein